MRRASVMDADEEAAHRRLERIKFLFSHTNQLQQSTATFEHAALRPLFYLNGGAVVVIFAFLGSGVEPRMDLGFALWALGCWALGLLCAAGAASLGYLSQLAFYKASSQHLNAELAKYDDTPETLAKNRAAHDKFNNEAQNDRNWGHGLGATSLLLFLFGIFWSVVAFVA